MCRSVQQIRARSTRMSTSLMPTVGLVTSSSQRPGSGLLLTSAFMGTGECARAFAGKRASAPFVMVSFAGRRLAHGPSLQGYAVEIAVHAITREGVGDRV